MPTTTPTRAKLGLAASVSVAPQRRGRIARRFMQGIREVASVPSNHLPMPRVYCLDGRQQLLNFRLHENAIGRNDARHVCMQPCISGEPQFPIVDML